MASVSAREIATFRRLRLNRNSMPRGDASPLDAHMEKMTTGSLLSLELVHCAHPNAGEPPRETPDLKVIGRDDQNVLRRNRAQRPVLCSQPQAQQISHQAAIRSSSSALS